jgi:hypothetical protein
MPQRRAQGNPSDTHEHIDNEYSYLSPLFRNSPHALSCNAVTTLSLSLKQYTSCRKAQIGVSTRLRLSTRTRSRRAALRTWKMPLSTCSRLAPIRWSDAQTRLDFQDLPDKVAACSTVPLNLLVLQMWLAVSIFQVPRRAR